MKKSTFLLFSVLILAAGFTSCKKIVDAIFSGVDIKAPDIEIGVPAVPFVFPIEIGLGTYSQDFNLDSAIKANTGGAFGIGVVSSIKVKSVTVSLTNADDNNNLSNFESARVMLSSNSKADPVELMNVTFPTTNTSTLTITPTDSPELLPYLKGGKLTYDIFGKARKTTSKQLTMIVSATMRVK